jgi:hypothetical protein
MSPPRKAAGHQVVHRRKTRHIDAADAAIARRSAMFQATTGPNNFVIGMKTTPMASIDTFPPKFTPTG